MAKNERALGEYKRAARHREGARREQKDEMGLARDVVQQTQSKIG